MRRHGAGLGDFQDQGRPAHHPGRQVPAQDHPGEFPQFWNVLKGEMSLVGTRPPTPDEVAQYQNWQRRRISIKPGITGLWQVSGRNRIEDFDEIVRLDLEYIDNWSLWLDIKLLLKTVKVVFSREGSF